MALHPEAAPHIEDKHRVSYLPFIADGGWDARQGECRDCGVTWVETRAVPAEGVLIDPDPHL